MGDLELVARVDNRLLLRDATGAEYRLPICPKLKSAVYGTQTAPQYAVITGPNSVISGALAAVSKVPTAEREAAANSALAPESSGNSVGASTIEGASTTEGAGTTEGPGTMSAKLTVVKDSPSEADPQPRLRPAELQIRLRAGDSPEELAQYSDLSAEQIARFAGPIEAERSEVIRAMRRTRLTVAEGAKGGARTVGDVVTQRLAARGITGEQLTWSARRDLGAPWLIELKFEDGGRPRSARWTFDHHRHQLIALDDEARWLSTPDATTTETVPITLHSKERLAQARHPRHAEPRVPEYPQVSGAPIPMPHSETTDSEAATVTRPDLRPVTSLKPVTGSEATDAADEAAEGGAAVAGIVPISRWQAEKLETVAMPITLPNATLPSSSSSSVNSPKTLPSDGSPTGVTPATAAKPVAKPLDPMSAALQAPGTSAPIDVTPTGSHPSLARRNSRSKARSWDDIVFGSKE